MRSGLLNAEHHFGGSHLGGEPCNVAITAPSRDRDIARVAAQLGAKTLATVRQVHGCRVVELWGYETAEQLAEIQADALISARPGLAVGVLTADCVPVLIEAQSRGMVAAVHAGRAGMLAGIVPVAVAALIERGASLDDLRIAVGPHIAAESYEVGEGLWAELPEAAQHRAADGRICCDLAGLLRQQCNALGLRADQIDWLAVDTLNSPNHHSYRRDAGAAGRQLSAIAP